MNVAFCVSTAEVIHCGLMIMNQNAVIYIEGIDQTACLDCFAVHRIITDSMVRSDIADIGP